MQLKKWWVIIVLSLLCFFFTGGLVYARQFAHQYENELRDFKPQCNLDGWKDSPSSQPAPTATPSPTPEILEIDTRNPDDMNKLDAFFDEYCKNNQCASPTPTPVPTKKPQPTMPTNPDDEIGFCYVEKNGTYEMTTKECMDLNKADPDYFRRKAYENCKEGKLPLSTDKCTEMFGLDY